MTLLGTDARLKTLADDLASSRYTVLSLDVFDTLLWRRVPEPIDVFFQVGDALKRRALLCERVSVVQFAELRAAAEKAARAEAEARTGSREILLQDIYMALPAHIWRDDQSRLTAIDVEVERESSSMVLDQDVAALLDVARNNGGHMFLRLIRILRVSS